MSLVRMFLSVALAAAAGCGGTPPFADVPDATLARSMLAAGSGSNVAATGPDQDDDRLHPRWHGGNLLTTRDHLVGVVRRLPRWSLAGTADSVLWATRTTRLWRFTDDVVLLLTPVGDSTRIDARSASRIGRSDFGQNRRNLAELWAALDER